LPAIPAKNSIELSKEEEWDRMINPQLYQDQDTRKGYRLDNNHLLGYKERIQVD